jgi:hypothetical protein
MPVQWRSIMPHTATFAVAPATFPLAPAAVALAAATSDSVWLAALLWLRRLFIDKFLTSCPHD